MAVGARSEARGGTPEMPNPSQHADLMARIAALCRAQLSPKETAEIDARVLAELLKLLPRQEPGFPAQAAPPADATLAEKIAKLCRENLSPAETRRLDRAILPELLAALRSEPRGAH